MFDYMDHFFGAVALPMWTMWSPASVQNNHTAAPVKVAAPELLEHSEPCLRNLHLHAPEPSGTCLRNLHQHAPELSRTSGNPPEPSGTLWNLLESASETDTSTPARAGTLRNLP